MHNIQVQILKETIQFGHHWIDKYSLFLKNTDPFNNFEINGVKLNNLYWLTAHLAYVEDVLLGKAIGLKGLENKWLKKFSKNSNQDAEGEVSYVELREIAQEIHLNCMNNLDKISDEDLNKDNILGIKFEGEQSIKTVLKHHIRHQNHHTGHLSNLCKLNGIKTF